MKRCWQGYISVSFKLPFNKAALMFAIAYPPPSTPFGFDLMWDTFVRTICLLCLLCAGQPGPRRRKPKYVVKYVHTYTTPLGHATWLVFIEASLLLRLSGKKKMGGHGGWSNFLPALSLFFDETVKISINFVLMVINGRLPFTVPFRL